MIRISDFYSIVKTFFKNIFSFKLSFEQQFKLFIIKAFEILFRVYVKKVDDNFFYSNERKNRFKSKGFVKRTVTTAFGYVTFERRKYVDKKTGVYYYIDEKIGLKRYRRLSEELIFTILFEYQHTAASFVAKTYAVSKEAEIHNMRMVAIHRGIEKVCKDRNKLIDKHTVMFPTSVSLEEVSEYVLNYLEKRYSMDKKKLIVNSDGGKWIDSFVGELRIYKPVHIYDKFHLVKAIGEISKRDKEISKNLYKWLEKDNFTELENFYETFKEKENISQRRKDQMKMLLNQYEKIRRIYTEKDYIGSRTEPLVSHECSRFLSSRPKAFSRKKIKRRAIYHTFFANYGKDRDKAHKLYFNGTRVGSMEKVIETSCLPDIISEAGKGTNIPYLRGGESLIREVLKEISQSRMI